MHQYRDIVVGSVYGHMNLDHFMFQDFEDVDKDVRDGYEMVKPTNKRAYNTNEEPIHAEASGNYLIDLRESWSKLPKAPSKQDLALWEQFQTLKDASDDARPDWEMEGLIDEYMLFNKKGKGKKKKPHNPEDYFKDIGGVWGERFSISHAAPSVVPNYFPTIRVYEYNVTGLGPSAADPYISSSEQLEHWLSNAIAGDSEQIDMETEDLQEERKKKKKAKKRRFHVPEPPSKASPPGPAYSPQTLSLLGYVQYYANLTRINNDFVVAKKDETLSPSDEARAQGWKEGKHHGKKPHDKDQAPHPKKFTYEVLYDTRAEGDMYELPDMSVRHYLSLAQRIGMFKPEKKSLQTEEDTESAEDSETEEETSLEKGKKGKKGGKKKKKHHHKNPRKINRPWYAFVRRAFVGTMELEEIEDEFGG